MRQFIFIHGLGQTQSSWDSSISFLSENILASSLDLTALCDSGQMTYQDLYCSFENYCDSCPNPLNLCGISLGAILALNYAINHSEKVQSLVLIAAQYKMPRLLLKFQCMIFRFLPKASFSNMGFSKSDFISLTSSMVDLDFSSYIMNISCPTLIVCGQRDNPNKKAARDLANHIPQAKIHLIENAGHEVNVDTPKELASIINSFFAL